MNRGGKFIVVNAGCRTAIVLVLLWGLSACGGGGGSESQESPEQITAESEPVAAEVALKNQAVLGPLSGAKIEVFRLDNLDSAVETVTAQSSSGRLDVAGSFDLVLDGLPPSEWVLVQATAGTDIDSDDDGIVDETPVGNRGSVHALARVADWLAGDLHVSPLTDMIYRDVRILLDLSSSTDTAILAALDSASGKWLNDVDGDSKVDYRDAVLFKPQKHKDKSRVAWSLILSGYVSAIHAGDNESMLADRMTLLESVIESPGYVSQENSATLVTSAPDSHAKVRILDADQDGQPDFARVEKFENDVYVASRIVTNDRGLSDHVISLDTRGHRLVLSFKGGRNILGESDQASLQALLDLDVVSVEWQSTDGDMLEISIPKSIVSLLSTATWNAMLDGQPLEPGRLFVLEDDPLLGWNVGEKQTTETTLYDVSGMTGLITIVSEWGRLAAEGLDPGLNIDVNMEPSPEGKNACAGTEVLGYLNAGVVENVWEGTIFYPETVSATSSDDYRCVSLTGYLVDAGVFVANAGLDQRTLFYYDPVTHVVALNQDEETDGYIPVSIGVTRSNYQLRLQISVDAPERDGWFSVFSFKQVAPGRYLVADSYEYDDPRLWIKVDDITPPPLYKAFNDTGITWGWDSVSGNNRDCRGDTITQQDCAHGRDAQAAAGTLTKVGGGNAGFDFTKLDASGRPLLDQSSGRWPCVRDNVTGLIWEVKNMDRYSLHSAYNNYVWFNSTGLNDGGYPGQEVPGNCVVDPEVSGATPGEAICDVEKFVVEVNAEALCGYTDWHLPTIEELSTIIDLGATTYVKVDANYFPYLYSGDLWSSTPNAYNQYQAWSVELRGWIYINTKWNPTQAMLVRGGR